VAVVAIVITVIALDRTSIAEAEFDKLGDNWSGSRPARAAPPGAHWQPRKRRLFSLDPLGHAL
jgi:hypothetical protein